MTVELEKIAGSFFISKGWKTFVHRTGLLSGQYIRFQVLTPSKINVLLFDKKKDSKLPMIPSSKKQIKTAPKRSTGITINDMPTSKHASMLISHTSNKETSSDSRTESMTDIPSSSDNSGETTRSFDDLCFCARNTAVTPDIKNYISIIGQFLQRSSKFYIVTMNNTFMKQDRLVEAAGSDSVTMLLHKSSDDRCNLKRGWATFAATNAIHLHSVCIFHFYKAPNVKITIDVL
uniref:TF-B3 domain-containing protein n=1 Tax=Oryza rufipogon TaxID=4529 RepID=A0A0E0R686_ORYRU